MFNASFLIDSLLKQLEDEKIMERKYLALKHTIYKIKEKGEFKVFDPNEYGVYDDRYYILHTNLKVYDKVTLEILNESISKESYSNLMDRIETYKTLENKALSAFSDLVFKDKAEIEDFCNYINSLLIIDKFKNGEFQ